MIKNVYKQQWELFKNDYWKAFVTFLLVFIFSGVSSYFLLLNERSVIEELMGKVVDIFEEKNMLEPDITSGEIALKLFVNNFLASLFVFLSGFIPIFIPAFLIIFLNGALIGVLFAYLKINGIALEPMLFAGILPHGIFEIPALVLAGALAFSISKGMYKKLTNSEFRLRLLLKNTFITFLSVCVLLLVIAALIEAFLTPILIEQFM
ncbi:stage II sporulation protein M [Fervidibacillus halotolerans]|uniref:Stage II sporulation protein M n=1 Tax=Fervidibacillus halotolerans TaxID=2980027 RepID=A0A9E8LYY8_9BACI|nr:stage II sporulation protein M [Fervidibacillus halotolerans]WAA12141.1 stage II sporulation protein M [Fervidibacillus halotolerans]